MMMMVIDKVYILSVNIMYNLSFFRIVSTEASENCIMSTVLIIVLRSAVLVTIPATALSHSKYSFNSLRINYVKFGLKKHNI